MPTAFDLIIMGKTAELQDALKTQELQKTAEFEDNPELAEMLQGMDLSQLSEEELQALLAGEEGEEESPYGMGAPYGMGGGEEEEEEGMYSPKEAAEKLHQGLLTNGSVAAWGFWNELNKIATAAAKKEEYQLDPEKVKSALAETISVMQRGVKRNG